LKIRVGLIGYFFGVAVLASCVTLHAPYPLLHASNERSSSVENGNVAAISASASNSSFGRAMPASERAARSYGDLPLSFELNRGQTDPQIKFLSRSSGYNLYLTDKEAVIGFRAPTRPAPKNAQRMTSPTTPEHSSFVRMKLVGAGAAARIIGLDELPGKTNYFIGNDPKKWRVNVPNYSRVRYQNAYPGVDVVFYGKGRQLEYDFIVAPGADFRAARIAFEGVQGVRLDASGDLLIATSSGEIRGRKPVIYQEAGGAKQPVEGGYVIRGEREVGFDVGNYDSNKTLVIDPVLVYSTTFGGSYNESANAIAVDNSGNAYIAGTTNSTDFPTVNPFQKLGRANAFVAKMNPAGTALLYSTYLGGSTFLGRGTTDGANGIAVDADGNAYVAGYVASLNFPTTPDAFQRKAVTGGSAFVTKLSAAGNALVYSTYLGGTGSNLDFIPYATSVCTSIAVGADGSAYTTGYTLSRSFPLRRAVQDQLNRGVPVTCCARCFHESIFGLSIIEDAFVTRLNPSGTGIVYSTYLGGTGQDEAYGIAIDLSGNAYVTGRTCSRDFASNAYGGGTSDSFLAKLSSSGRELLYCRLLGGSGNDAGNGIAVDSSGNAYVAGQTDSFDFPATPRSFQAKPGGSASYASPDGGVSWNAATGLPNSSVNVVAIDPPNPSTIYAGLGDCSAKAAGVFKSTDGGATWRSSGLEGQIIEAIAIDPKQSSTVYAGSSKSTDGGATWNYLNTSLPIGELTIDPVTPTTLYAISNGLQCGDGQSIPDFSKTTDGGTTWKRIPDGRSFFGASSMALDPQNSTTLYAIGGNLFESTDGGSSWRIPYSGNRNFVRLAIAPTDPSTIYLSDPGSNIFKSTDRGRTFAMLARIDNSINQLLVDPTNSSTLYAALGSDVQSGGVFKSTDGGQTWKTTDLTGVTVNAVAIDPFNSSRIYAGTSFDTDGFLAKVNAGGNGLVYSTYIGTRSPDVVAGIGIDAAGNTYVAGKTFSDRFFTRDALLVTKPGGPFDIATFTTKLDAMGSAILFSSYLGSSEPSFGSAIAVDAAGKAYVAGTTGLRSIVPSARLPESAHGGFDAFVIKIASPPRITGATISGKNLIVSGEGFDLGAVILVGGVEQRSKNDQSNPATVLVAKKAAKSIAQGQSVTIQVRNSDGLISETFSFTR
jgi:photosystem II stability/assembly factor-like uncharacterized protein